MQPSWEIWQSSWNVEEWKKVCLWRIAWCYSALYISLVRGLNKQVGLSFLLIYVKVCFMTNIRYIYNI